MIPLNLEVVDFNRGFQQLMLHLLHNDIFAIDQNQDVTRTKMHRRRPALDRGIEGMRRRRYDLFTLDEDMYQFR